MAASAFFLVYYFSLCLLTRGSVSAPATAFSTVQNLTINSLSLHPLVSPLDTIPLLNVTSPPDIGVRYLVPNTQITIDFYLGFRIDEVAMQHTIDAARNYCNLQLEKSGDVPLPQTEDPFHDDLGYGAAIHVVSTKPRQRITWEILKGIIQGLWNFLVEEGRYMEAEFHVEYANVGSVGKGTITEAAKAPSVEQ